MKSGKKTKTNQRKNMTLFKFYMNQIIHPLVASSMIISIQNTIKQMYKLKPEQYELLFDSSEDKIILENKTLFLHKFRLHVLGTDAYYDAFINGDYKGMKLKNLALSVYDQNNIKNLQPMIEGVTYTAPFDPDNHPNSDNPEESEENSDPDEYGSDPDEY
jgi:hypothetical protein